VGVTAATEQLHEAIAAYNDAWNAHGLDGIASLHAPDMVFENHTAGERAEGDEALGHIAAIFEAWPDIAFETQGRLLGLGVDPPPRWPLDLKLT
jgi:ketosteroid isomerase-like protein